MPAAHLSRLCRRVATALLLGALLLPTGCTYAKDRVLDLTDVIDWKVGSGLGVGAKAEITYYTGVGAGIGIQGWLWEWYGRRAYETWGDKFAQFAFFGQDGGMWGPGEDDGLRARPDTYAILVNMSAYSDHMGDKAAAGFREVWGVPPGYEVPPLGTRWRVGGEFMIPALSFGAYLNLGELADFLLGFSTYDFREDDGVSKFASYSLGEPAEDGPVLPPDGREMWKRKERDPWNPSGKP